MLAPTPTTSRLILCGVLMLPSLPHSHAGGNHHGHHSHPTGKPRQAQIKRLDPVNFDRPYQPRTLRAADTTLGQPALFGQWSDVMSWPLIAVHATLLPNGKVLAWDATPDDFDDDPHTTEIFTTRVTLWDPQTNIHIPTNNDTNYDLFCAGSAHLWDGRILFAGGDSGTGGANAPLSNTSIYDPDTNTWRSVGEMATPRWYSSVAALPNGEMLTYAGTYSPDPVAEVFQFDESWRPLQLPVVDGLSVDYQWMQSTPEGNVMTFGPQNRLAIIDPDGDGSLTEGPNRDQFPERRYGSYAMYDIGKVLVAGGTDKDGGPASYDSSVIIDTLTRQTVDTSPMGIARTQHNLTILADGSVLASGGNSDGTRLVSPDAGVFRPEIWNPDTGQWRFMNDMQVDRQYHSIALLLPDGRVLSAGGGYCGDCELLGYEEQNAEIFSPPYLFSSGDTAAVRPTITIAPDSLDYNRSFSVNSSQAARIVRAHLIKPGSVTHSQNQDQRLVPLSFTRSGNTLQLTSPDNRNIAPPGHYMLFLVNDQGVPSIGKMIRIGQPLISSGQTVTNTLKAAASDEYVIQSNTGDATLQVLLSGQSSTLQLAVDGETVDGSRTAECTVSDEDSAECLLSNQQATRWLLRVSGATSTPYSLVATLSDEENPQAIQPLATGTGTVTAGGGSFGSWLAMLLCVARHQRCTLTHRQGRARSRRCGKLLAQH